MRRIGQCLRFERENPAGNLDRSIGRLILVLCQFNPLIISGYGFSQSKTTLMATPQAAVALVAQVFCTTLAFFIPNIRCVLWVLGTLPALAGAVMIHGKEPNFGSHSEKTC